MRPVLRIFAIFAVFCATSIAWFTLGGITQSRSHSQSYDLRDNVGDLWGRPQSQTPPELVFHWDTTRQVSRTEWQGKTRKDVRETVKDHHEKAVPLESSTIRVDLDSDMRRKGLVWYSLYDINFDAGWSYVHREQVPGELNVAFRFPDPNGIYDNFALIIDGVDHAPELTPVDGVVALRLPVRPEQTVEVRVGYVSRGMDEWRYTPSTGVGLLKNFDLSMTTDFADIDFPQASMSPSDKTRRDAGWLLNWNFKQVVTGHSVGMVTPTRIQPGELASDLSFSAPISLLFFFVIIFVFATLRRIDIHPINYLFLGSAFFAFHMLFAYSVDHLTVIPAFALASVVSVILVVSYLRLVVSPSFAFREAALAQLLYMVGFSLAHFWDGFTGLTITVLAIITLFAVMQLTGRVRWSEVLARSPSGAALPEPSR